MPSPITVSLDESPADVRLRRGVEGLAHLYETTISAVGRAALSTAIDDPRLIESRLSRRLPGKRMMTSTETAC